MGSTEMECKMTDRRREGNNEESSSPLIKHADWLYGCMRTSCGDVDVTESCMVTVYAFLVAAEQGSFLNTEFCLVTPITPVGDRERLNANILIRHCRR